MAFLGETLGERLGKPTGDTETTLRRDAMSEEFDIMAALERLRDDAKSDLAKQKYRNLLLVHERGLLTAHRVGIVLKDLRVCRSAS